MKKTPLMVCAALLTAAVLCACNAVFSAIPSVDSGKNGSSKDTGNIWDTVTSTADPNSVFEYSFPEPPAEITDLMRENAEKTYLQTDKSDYNYDERIKYNIITVSETAFVGYGSYIEIQGWDEEKGEWVDACENTAWTDEYCVSIGGGSNSFKASVITKGYAKYRIVKDDISVDNVAVKACSNEFTLN